MDAKDFAPQKAPTENGTVEEARRKIWKLRSKGTKCPCCGQNCKMYKRAITFPMARWLRDLVRLWRNRGGGWIQIDDPELAVRGGDYARLRHWGLVRARSDNVANSPLRGGWQPTELGALWVDGNAGVAKYAHLYLGRCVGFSGAEVMADDILRKEDQ